MITAGDIRENIIQVLKKNTRKTKNIFSLSLSTQVILGILLGITLGIIMRYYPNLLSFLCIDAVSFKCLGTIFIKLIKMIATLLIFSCILSSTISLFKQKNSSKNVAIITLSTFAITLISCVAIGMAFAIFFQPGANAEISKDFLLNNNTNHSLSKGDKFSISSFLINIVPENIFISFSENNFLQIIFFSIIMALAISKVDKDNKIYKGIKTFADICMFAIQIVMKFTPFGAFGITVWLVATQDVKLASALAKLIIVDWISVFFIIYVLFSLVSIFILKLNPIHMWKKLFSAQSIAFFTTSSSATLPIGMKIAEEKLGVNKEKLNFVAPFSAAINSGGGATYFSVITIFMAQLFNIELTTQQYITLFIMSFICDLGVAPVPSGSLIMLGNIFVAVGIPFEALGIALAIDRLMDMARTLLNFTCDIFSAIVVDRLTGTLDVKQYNKEKKKFIFF